jgi:hypothetical protein
MSLLLCLVVLIELNARMRMFFKSYEWSDLYEVGGGDMIFKYQEEKCTVETR